jgi:hypothetical protein
MSAIPKQTLRISYDTIQERDEKLISIVRRLGYRVEPALPERLTVSQLADRVNRRPDTVSMSLKRPSCPPYECLRGKRRILWIEPSAALLAFLSEDRKGQRPPQKLRTEQA